MPGDTMERILPDLIAPADTAGQLSLQLHKERYQFACKHLLKGAVLDIACGSGYGTQMLAECSNQLCIGVDVSSDAISYARERYADPRIRFVCEDLMLFKSNERFLNIVSFETIEHVPEPANAISHLHDLLLPGGQLIISVPVTPSTDANPFHVNDFTSASFRKLLSIYGFTELASMEQKQPYTLREILQKKNGRTGQLRQGLLSYYISHPHKFLLRIRSLLTDGLCNRYLVLVLRKDG